VSASATANPRMTPRTKPPPEPHSPTLTIAREQARAKHVHGKDLRDPIGRIGQRQDGARAGIVHQHIQLAPGVDRLRNGTHGIVRRGRIRDQAGNIG